MAKTDQERTCTSTGLALIPCKGEQVWRVQKSSYGAFNPKIPRSRSEVAEWGRWDVLDHRTIYAAKTRLGSYLETLQSLRLDRDKSPLLTDLFDDEPPDGATLLDATEEEWDGQFRFKPGDLPAGWRTGRSLYRLRLPSKGYLINIGHGDSLEVIEDAFQAQLTSQDIDDLTLEHLYGSNRRLTTLIATWARALVLDDGSLPVGIRFRSKWGDEQMCYAIWLRALDDGKELSSEPTKLRETLTIECNDEDLRRAMHRHGLRRCF